MSARDRALTAAVDARRANRAADEWQALVGFCAVHGLTPSPEAVALYLSSLLDGVLHGRGLRYRLGLLDLHERLVGRPPPSQDAELRTYLRGLHRLAALAGPERGVEPLRREDVDALTEAATRPSPTQVRDAALLLVAGLTSLPAQVLHDMRWDHLRFTEDSVVLNIPPPPRRGPRPYSPLTLPRDRPGQRPREALLAWRRLAGPANGLLWAWHGHPYDVATMRPVLRALGPATSPPDIGHRRVGARVLRAAVADALAPRPLGLRDRALLLLGYAGALGTEEAGALRLSDVGRRNEGLLLHIRGRTRTIAVPARRDDGPCPVDAWTAWREAMRAAGRSSPAGPAFPQIGEAVGTKRMQAPGLNALVQQRAEQAGYTDRPYSFTSLRAGFLRTAARAGVPNHIVAVHAGLTALRSLDVHRQRELLVSCSAASRVGL